MNAEQIISMHGVCKSYKMGSEKLDVLKEIDFSVNRGEFTAILGPSGSGKSTLSKYLDTEKFSEETHTENGK